MQMGRVPKASATAYVDFEHNFTSNPAVVVNAVWPNGGVGHAETLQQVDTRGFSLISGNAAHNYFVNWVAIGEG